MHGQKKKRGDLFVVLYWRTYEKYSGVGEVLEVKNVYTVLFGW